MVLCMLEMRVPHIPAIFIDAQEAIQTKYGDQVKAIALNNVAEGTESEYLQQLVDAGCDLIFTTSYNYGTVTKEFDRKISRDRVLYGNMCECK